MARLFIAIDLPADLKEQVLQSSQRTDGVRWTKKEQMHVTLEFVGDADEELQRQIISSLHSITWSPFELCVGGEQPLFLPSKRRPSVFALTIDGGTALTDLKQDVDRALDDIGFEVDKRAFKPHLTIARLKGRRTRSLADTLSGGYHFAGGTMVVDCFHLYSSVLQQSGAEHRKEATFAASAH